MFNKCKKCNTTLQPLFNSWYCPNDCDITCDITENKQCGRDMRSGFVLMNQRAIDILIKKYKSWTKENVYDYQGSKHMCMDPLKEQSRNCVGKRYLYRIKMKDIDWGTCYVCERCYQEYIVAYKDLYPDAVITKIRKVP